MSDVTSFPLPSKAFNALMRMLQFILVLAGYAIAGVALNPVSSVLMVFALGILATCVHEGGHWLGARWGGMTVLYVRVFAVELQLLKRGFRCRLGRLPKNQGFSGYVIARNKPNQPWRGARLRLIAMGPLMNLIVGALSLLIASLTFNSAAAVGAYALAFAAINVVMGLANLLPTFNGVYSDGAQLLTWWRWPNAGSAKMAHARLLAHSTAGVAAADLPAADLDILRRHSAPAPLVPLAYRLEALQAAGDWASTVAVGAEAEAHIKANPAVRETDASFIATLRAQVELCHAILHRNADGLKQPIHNGDATWYAPTLVPHRRAVQAALAGDRHTAEQHLQTAARIAENSRNLSTYPHHLALASHIRGLLPLHTEEQRPDGSGTLDGTFNLDASDQEHRA